MEHEVAEPRARRRVRSASDTDHLRVPPHSVEAEQAVLGGLLLDNAAWDTVADRLSAELAGLKVRAKDGTLVDLVQPMLMRHLMCHGLGFSQRNRRAMTAA